jgi:hypothetical protein
VTIPLIVGLVIGFGALAPRIYASRGAAALWLAVGVASLLTGLLMVAVDPGPPGPGATSLGGLFFWFGAIAGAAGFIPLALVIRRRQRRGASTTGWQDLLRGLAVWLVGATAGGAVALGVGFLLLSAMAG